MDKENTKNLEQSSEQSQSGLFVYLKEVSPGVRQVEFELVGGFDLLAAPSTFELAYKVARSRLGLD